MFEFKISFVWLTSWLSTSNSRKTNCTDRNSKSPSCSMTTINFRKKDNNNQFNPCRILTESKNRPSSLIVQSPPFLPNRQTPSGGMSTGESSTLPPFTLTRGVFLWFSIFNFQILSLVYTCLSLRNPQNLQTRKKKLSKQTHQINNPILSSAEP